MVITAFIVYSLLALLMGCQARRALSLYRPELRRTHGHRMLYLRNRKTGRVQYQTRNLFDFLSLGI